MFPAERQLCSAVLQGLGSCSIQQEAYTGAVQSSLGRLLEYASAVTRLPGTLMRVLLLVEVQEALEEASSKVMSWYSRC